MRISALGSETPIDESPVIANTRPLLGPENRLAAGKCATLLGLQALAIVPGLWLVGLKKKDLVFAAIAASLSTSVVLLLVHESTRYVSRRRAASRPVVPSLLSRESPGVIDL